MSVCWSWSTSGSSKKGCSSLCRKNYWSLRAIIFRVHARGAVFFEVLYFYLLRKTFTATFSLQCYSSTKFTLFTAATKLVTAFYCTFFRIFLSLRNSRTRVFYSPFGISLVLSLFSVSVERIWILRIDSAL